MSAARIPFPGLRADLIECSRCSQELPFEANFCVRCGEPQRPEAAGSAPVPVERCEVVWWKGYVKGGFFAVPTGSIEPGGARLASSRLFWALRTRVPEDTEIPAAAHGELVARLVADG